MIHAVRPRARLYCEAHLQQHSTLSLPAKASHYLANVLRAQAGEQVLLFNGQDGEWRAEILAASKKTVDLRLIEQTREPCTVPDVWLLFAPLKAGRIDFLVEKATELGVAELLPIKTDYTNAGRVNEDRLTSQAIEAAEQSERCDVPKLHPYRSLESLLSAWPQDRTLLYGDETGSGKPLMEVLSTLPVGAPLALLIGPEGGFSPTEHDWLKRLAFAAAFGLGPRILRAETAAITALACVQAVRGDWSEPPRWREIGI